MSYRPIQTELVEKWNLRSDEYIAKKIFEDYEDEMTLKDLLVGEKFLVCGAALGKILAHDVRLKANQLKNFYDYLTGIKANLITNADQSVPFNPTQRTLVLSIKTKLATAKARRKKEVGPFYFVVDPLIDLVYDIEDYTRLCSFVETIMAYHKLFGGWD